MEKFLRPNGQVAEELEEEKEFFDLPDVNFPRQLNNPFLQDIGKTNNEALSYSM